MMTFGCTTPEGRDFHIEAEDWASAEAEAERLHPGSIVYGEIVEHGEFSAKRVEGFRVKK